MGERHRPIRARSAPGQVAEAATESHGLSAHRPNRRALLRSPQQESPVPGDALLRGRTGNSCGVNFHAPNLDSDCSTARDAGLHGQRVAEGGSLVDFAGARAVAVGIGRPSRRDGSLLTNEIAKRRRERDRRRRLVADHQLLACRVWSSAASAQRRPGGRHHALGPAMEAATGQAARPLPGRPRVRSRSTPSSLSRSRRSRGRTSDEPSSPTARRCASAPRTPVRSKRTRSSTELSSTR